MLGSLSLIQRKLDIVIFFREILKTLRFIANTINQSFLGDNFDAQVMFYFYGIILFYTFEYRLLFSFFFTFALRQAFSIH